MGARATARSAMFRRSELMTPKRGIQFHPACTAGRCCDGGDHLRQHHPAAAGESWMAVTVQSCQAR